jgi:hypothetical protein
MLNVIENDRADALSQRRVSPATSRYDAAFLSIDTEPPSRMILILNALQCNMDAGSGSSILCCVRLTSRVPNRIALGTREALPRTGRE